ncbi:MAG: FAD:protein FMN transferase [Desulfuromonadales bacterium]|nr:FAD:protein FMN transferase [Desulfuromonadales bacterium]
MPWNRPWLLVVLLTLILAMSWWHWRPAGGEARQVRLLMGTTVEIVAFGDNQRRLEQAIDAAMDEMARLERLLGNGYPESDPDRINASDSAVTVAAETAAVLDLGLEIAQLSNGAFDLGLGRLKTLWGMEGPAPRVPDAGAVEAALAGVGPTALQLDGPQVTRRAAVAIDLGGIAKGEIVDHAVALLRRHGIEQAAVNAGGDMYLLGRHRDRPWRIGIQHPRQPGEVAATLHLADRAVVTSGDYERFFEQDGVRYHHLFDPRSGYPADACQSVTVVAESAVLADALATALFVLGVEDGLALLAHFPGSDALMIDAAGRQHLSAGMAAWLEQP